MPAMDLESHTCLPFDTHLSVSMNAPHWNRGFRWKLEKIRASERGHGNKPERDNATAQARSGISRSFEPNTY
jgi:hypothetical protein